MVGNHQTPLFARRHAAGVYGGVHDIFHPHDVHTDTEPDDEFRRPFLNDAALFLGIGVGKHEGNQKKAAEGVGKHRQEAPAGSEFLHIVISRRFRDAARGTLP